MVFLEIILIFVLQFEGTSGHTVVYGGAGDRVVLKCNFPSSSLCSDIEWLHVKTNENANFLEIVKKGTILQRSPQAARLDLNSECSLIINNITAGDAGRYICRIEESVRHHTDVYLSILTISPSDVDPAHGEISLKCSLWRHSDVNSCSENSISWTDQTGMELLGRGGGNFLSEKCVYDLTVTLQSVKNKNVTCKFVEGSNVKIEAVSTGLKRLSFYHRVGDDVVLNCDYPSSCSAAHWLYNKNNGQKTELKAANGKVTSSKVGLNENCSLIVNDITAEDAGRYTCQLKIHHAPKDLINNLNVLTISSPDADQQKEGDVTLKCSMFRFDQCPEKSIRWLNESGVELIGEGNEFRVEEQTGCVSYLTLKGQRRNRRFTCQFVEQRRVKIEVHYTPVSIEESILPIVIGAVIGVLVFLLVVGAAVLIKRRRTKAKEDQILTDVQSPSDPIPQTQHNDQGQAGLTYATLNQFNPKPAPELKIKQEEDTVTYSAVRMNMRTQERPDSVYSQVNKPK